MNQKGFGLILIIITFAILVLLAGSGIYFSMNGQKATIERGNDAIKQAEDAVKVLEDLNKNAGKELQR
jgi:flagellar basal body-associated protein FliL